MSMYPMEYPDEINHPWHPQHPLRIIELESISDVICRSCGKQTQEKEEEEAKETRCYGCTTCGDFDVHLDCAKNPPPLVVDQTKIHKHPLTLLPREVSFICNACGTKGKASPYVCLSCCFMIHIDCINLPRVIRINHHPHRVSHTLSLPSDLKLNCQVCHKGIDSRYGAYSCLECPTFHVHVGCATIRNVWDGVELDGVPGEKTPPPPFNVTSEDRIKHFSHEEHELRRITDDCDDHNARCYACNLDVFTEPFYKCVESLCGFILHEECAKLPRETRSPIHRHTLTLHYEEVTDIFPCKSCCHVSNGFRYSCSQCRFLHFDSKCVSVTERLLRGGHRHPLYFKFDYRTCCACEQIKLTPVSCGDCRFALCFECATLPKRIRYKDDAHLLSLNNDGKLSEDLQKNWCDSCETQVNPLKIFYECRSCRTAVHTSCARGGDLRNMRVGSKFQFVDQFQVVATDQLKLRRCNFCERHHEGPAMLTILSDEGNIIPYCSYYCLDRIVFFVQYCMLRN
ncbi:unnamed protein product [Microthlaspi erraticum]|uniref:Zinc finger PHD-type domain-containing protein n=1 Tax=Microthlaspi erraticum TaxID=1685480 RepID=A0A6D2J442_9BRAS|nr:unnamed protein product [Microthlaspi erraticum]